MDFMYYLYGDGTERGYQKDLDDLSKLIELGYLGYSIDPGESIMVYKPFKLGVDVDGHRSRGKHHQLHTNM